MIKRDKLSIIDFDFCPLTLEITPEESLVIKNKFNWRISKGGSICRKSKNIECTITKEYITQLFFNILHNYFLNKINNVRCLVFICRFPM